MKVSATLGAIAVVGGVYLTAAPASAFTIVTPTGLGFLCGVGSTGPQADCRENMLRRSDVLIIDPSLVTPEVKAIIAAFVKKQVEDQSCGQPK